MLTVFCNNLVFQVSTETQRGEMIFLRLYSELEPAEDSSQGSSGETALLGIRMSWYSSVVSSICARSVVPKVFLYQQQPRHLGT